MSFNIRKSSLEHSIHKTRCKWQFTPNNKDEFEQTNDGHMYFLCSEDAVNERFELLPNRGISQNLKELLEHIIRSQSNYTQSFMIMREVELACCADAEAI